jgi:hypothetical protein
MGGKTKSEIKTQITNELSTEINNKTTNINRVTNSATTELTQSISNKAEASVEVNTSGTNETDIDEIIIEAGGTANIEQNMKLAAVTNALISILTDASQKQTNINDLTDKIKNQINNDQNLKQDVEFLAKIGKSSSDAGGPEAFVNALADTVQTLISTIGNIGGSSSSINETEIRNTIKTQINNEVINENELNNSISTSIKNSMDQLGTGKCKTDTTGVNTLRSRKLLVGEDGTFNFKQTLDISSFTTCIIELKLASNLASDLTNKFIVDTSSDTTNKQGVDTKAKVDADIKDETIKDSSIMKSIDNLVNNVGDLAGSWIYIIGGIVGLIILIIVAVILVPMMRSSSVSSRDDGDGDADDGNADDGNADDGDDHDNQRGGGNINSDIYLFASFIAIFILIANKSLPLCGVLLIVIILYLVNKKKPELLSLQN